MKITEILNDKRILLWGYGLEGKSTEKFINKYCKVKELTVFQGKRGEIDEDAYDYIIKSPGIVAWDLSDKFTSMTDLFLSEFADRVIGVTGTKGKSTTSSLMYTVLSKCTDRPTLLVGNIGLPALDYYGSITEDTIIVFEMSCHQLAHAKISPHIALFLNLYEEHLDYYGTMDKYFRAKANITLNQKPGDYLFVGNNVPELETAAAKTVISYDDPMHFDMNLKGEHNQFNARFVYTISTQLFGCDPDEVRAALKEFTGLRHRMQFAGNYGGVDYYDDSISTIPEAAIAAIRSIPNAGTILLGGMDRNIDYDILVEFIREHGEYNYILMYKSGARIFGEVRDLPCCRYREDLQGAQELRGARRRVPAADQGMTPPLKGLFMKPTATLAFTGDIGFDHYMQNKWEDEELIDPALLDILTSSDHVIANVEGPMAGEDAVKVKAAEMRLMHTINPAAAVVLDKIHADIWNLANNHIMDVGPDGLEMTLEEARRHGAQTIGAEMDLERAKRPVILNEAGGIGLFGVGYQRGCKPAGPDKAGCLSWSDMDSIREVITGIKKKCRWCVVVAHGGEEFTAIPTPYTRDRYLEYLKMGADVVVSHHPHVPMNYELVGDKAIFYSLGNFIFDTPYQRAQFNTEKGIVLQLHFTQDSYSFTAHGLKIDRTNEHIVSAELPKIFVDVQEDEYNKLIPLACKMFIAATKRQQVFLYPEKYANATEAEWEENLMNPKRSGRVIGEGLDFYIICPIAAEAEKGAWKESKLEQVKEFILEQM